MIIICCNSKLKFKQMQEESHENSRLNQDSRMHLSRLKSKKKGSKLSQYETNMENFIVKEKFALEKINPKGIKADAIYVSFSGVIECAQLFIRENEDFQVSYQLIVGEQWHDETPESSDLEGISTFCEAKNGQITFSLSFDCLLSCVYIQSWPQLILTIKGFNFNGDLITKGYAQIHLPIESGRQTKEAHIFSIHREERWYQKLLPFLAPNPLALDQKDFERIIGKGEGREVEKIRSIGKIFIQAETLKRNYSKFGYK